MNKNNVKILLVIAFLVVGIIPLAIIGTVSLKILNDTLVRQTMNQLLTVRESRKRQIEKYFADRKADMGVLVDIVGILRKDSQQDQELEAWGNDLIPFSKNYIEEYNYYDFFLIRPDGYCFYSVTYEADYQTNLVNGPYANSGLGNLVKQVLQTKQFGFADFEPYPPSNNIPAAFVAQPLIQNNEVELIVALQLSLDSINQIMQQREGLGATGETYLVGPDKLMRSDSFLDPEYHSVAASFANPTQGKVDTEAVHNALAGNTGERIVVDYNGNPVISAYTPIEVGDTTWVLLAEIDEAEAFMPVNRLRYTAIMLLIVCLVPIVVIAIVMSRVVDSSTSGNGSSKLMRKEAGKIPPIKEQQLTENGRDDPTIEEELINMRNTIDRLIKKLRARDGRDVEFERF